MDEDRYYNLGSHDKLFNQIDELTDALASRDTEIKSLRQQLVAFNHNRKAAYQRHKEARTKLVQQLAANNPLLDEAADELDRQKAEIESLRQKLSAAKEEITLDEQRVADLMSQVGELSEQLHDAIKREVMLRNAIHDGCLCIAQYGEQPPDCLIEALAATADLDGLILCEKEPVACSPAFGKIEWIEYGKDAPEGATLYYRAWEPK